MQAGRRHEVFRAVVALVMIASVLAAPLLAAAVPPSTTTSAAIEAKQAEQAAAQQELDRMRRELSDKVTDYVRLGKLLQDTRVEISQVATQMAQADLQLAETQAAMTDRIVEIYRGDKSGLIALLFDAQTIQDFMLRLNYLTAINARDARLVEDLRLERDESAWLHQNLKDREQRLVKLQEQADTQRDVIVAAIDQQQAKATAIGADIAALMRQAAMEAALVAGGDPPIDFTPDIVITDENFHDSASMTVDDVQTFLEQQPGTLATFSAPDHAGAVKSAAQIIVEAASAWGVNPKVILATMQKEQSLLSRKSPTDEAYDWAMGCGKADSRTFYEYQGFGKQIWGGAEKLSKNGGPWHPGIQLTIDGNVVLPANSSTYSLYKYTPHLRGTMSFWLIYWRYFGDPMAPPV